MSKYSDRDIVSKIAARFAESNSDIEIIFSLYLEPGETMRISK